MSIPSGAVSPRTILASVAMAIILSGACKGAGGADGAVPEAPRAPIEAPRQVRSYPHDPTAFTQGLVFHEGALYESTGRYGQSTLRRVELETGRVLEKVDLEEQYFAEGVALLNGKLYQLTWREGVGFVYGLDMARQGTFPFTGEGWGLTTDGASLIVSDGSNVLRFLDPATYQQQRTISVTDGDEYVHQLNELEWVRGEIWANVWHDNRIARIDPQSGKVKAWVDLGQIIPTPRPSDGEAVPNGIAYDAATGRLFVTGKLWPQLFEISVAGLGGAAAADSGAAR
jgi:glutaminyl-peptide cyclotransferase